MICVDKQKSKARIKIDLNKPILLIQTTGGPANPDPTKPHPNPYSWSRDIPHSIAQEVVNAFKDEYQIFHIRYPDQPALEHTQLAFSDDFQTLAYLISISDKRLFIDSFAQHAAAALGMPSVVCWVTTKPYQFGYEMHTNILANPETAKPDLRGALYQKYNILGLDPECPYNSMNDIFDADAIIKAVKEQKVNIGVKVK